MIFTKKQINRAYDEFYENAKNIIDASYENFPSRLRQLFRCIRNNEVISHIIIPYLEMDIESSEFGLVDGLHSSIEYKIPDDDDEEIAVLLQILNQIKDREREIINLTLSMYKNKHIQDNVEKFNHNIVMPAFNKMLRKFRYKVEDINEEDNEEIDSKKINIINYGNINATNSVVGIGNDIKQENTNDVFVELKDKINQEIDDEEESKKLYELVERMENNITNKPTFKEAYDTFLIEVGKYMNIVGPFLPYLSEYL